MPMNDKAVCWGFRGSPAHLQEFSSCRCRCYNAIKTNTGRGTLVIMLLCVHVYSYFDSFVFITLFKNVFLRFLFSSLTFNLNTIMGNQVFAVIVPNDS